MYCDHDHDLNAVESWPAAVRLNKITLDRDENYFGIYAD